MTNYEPTQGGKNLLPKNKSKERVKMTSSVAKGNQLEEEIFKQLQQIGIESKRIGGRDDEGVDIHGQLLGRNFIIQCKNYTYRKIGEFSLSLLSYYVF
jgi:hypothetical protein